MIRLTTRLDDRYLDCRLMRLFRLRATTSVIPTKEPASPIIETGSMMLSKDEETQMLNCV